jgi:hypothetical protein
MPHFLISFNDGDMQFSESEFPEVSRSAHQVLNEAIDAGVWVFGGGFQGYFPQVVLSDGTVHERPLAASEVRLGGFSILKVADEKEAHRWAAKFATACRCAQEVRRIMDDPEQEAAIATKELTENSK